MLVYCTQVDSVLFSLMHVKVTVQTWRTSLSSLIIASFTFSLSLIIRGWGGTISSIQKWPSGSSSSALTTFEWYDGLYRPVGCGTYCVSSIGHKSMLIYTFYENIFTIKMQIINIFLVAFVLTFWKKCRIQNYSYTKQFLYSYIAFYVFTCMSHSVL